MMIPVVKNVMMTMTRMMMTVMGTLTNMNMLTKSRSRKISKLYHVRLRTVAS